MPKQALAKMELEMATDEEIYGHLKARQCPLPHLKAKRKDILENAFIVEQQKGHPGARILSYGHVVPKKNLDDILDSYAGVDTDSDEEEAAKGAGKKKKDKRKLATDQVKAVIALGYDFPNQWFSHFDQVCAFAPLVTEEFRCSKTTREHQQKNKDGKTKNTLMPSKQVQDSVVLPELSISVKEEGLNGVGKVWIISRALRSMPGKETGKIRPSDWHRRHIVILCLEVKMVDSVPTVTDILVMACTCFSGAIVEKENGGCWHVGCALYVLRDLPRPAACPVPQSSTAERNLWVLLRQNFSVKSISSLMTMKELMQRRKTVIEEAKSRESGQEASEPRAELDIISKESVDDAVCVALTRLRERVKSEQLSGQGSPAASLHHHPTALQVALPKYPYLDVIDPRDGDEGVHEGTRADVEKRIGQVRGKKSQRKRKKKKKKRRRGFLHSRNHCRDISRRIRI